jgi:hypothetical protein
MAKFYATTRQKVLGPDKILYSIKLHGPGRIGHVIDLIGIYNSGGQFTRNGITRVTGPSPDYIVTFIAQRPVNVQKIADVMIGAYADPN